MATILNADIQVDYLADNRQKRLSWLGGTNETYTMNEIYSAMATLLDEDTTIDDGTCFSAETPVEYTIGKIDSGDTEPWYITFDLMEHITSGALKTNGWTRVEGTNTGIIMVPVTAASRTIVTADCGYNIVTDTDGDTGTLLEVIDTGGATDYLIVRPDTSAIGNSFNNAPTAGDGLTCNTNTAVQTAAATTGDQIWANIYSIGTIADDSHIYVYQGAVDTDGDRVRVVSWNDATQDWWSDGHINICVALKDITQTTWTVIDGGYLSVFARKYAHLYDNFEVSNSIVSGGRNPIPLGTASDLNNTTGYRTVTLSGDNWAAGWTVGDEFSGDSSGARGIITAITTPGSTQTMEYYLVADPLTDFTADENVTNEDDTGTGDIDATGPEATGPSLNTWFTSNTTPTIAFGNVTADIDDDSTDEYYGISIHCQNNPLSEVYEWIKYATRRGETTNDLDGINGESYIGGEVYLAYGTITNSIAEGEDLLQATSLATGIVVSHDTTNKVILLRDVRGTFSTSYQVDSQDSSGYFTPTVATAFSPAKQSPLGTFAGGTFFGARGVLITNYLDADANAFILTPIEGGTKERPPSVQISVTNLIGTSEATLTDDRVAIFRLTGSGGDVEKDTYACDGGEAIGDATIATDAIAQDEPGKTAGGVLVLVDIDDGGKEYNIRFDSWTTDVFTLSNMAFSAAADTTTTTIKAASGFTAGAKRGDLVLNKTRSNAVSYITQVVSDTEITISPAIPLQVETDLIELNAVPVVTTSSDKVYVALLKKHANSDTESVSVIYIGTIYFRVKVRNTRASDPDGPIKPFSSDGSTSGTDQSVQTIRTIDTVIT